MSTRSVLCNQSLIYSPEYVWRILKWQESGVNDYLYNFPQRKLTASPDLFYFTETPTEAQISGLFEDILEVDNFETFLEDADTQTFIVIHNDKIL